ncbi:MAG: Calx-beta domain-containing protein, partial [candidate division WOR-3 bacterium]
MPKIKNKITNSHLLIVISLSVIAAAQAITFNNYKIPAKTGYEAFNESFTSTTFPPPGWDTINFFGNYVTWYRRTNNPNTAPACAATNASGPGDPYHANEWLISPRIKAYPFDTLFFWYRSNDNSNNETVFVRLSKYPDQHDTSYYYIYGKVITANNNNQWYRDTVPLSAITSVFGESCYIAIQHYRAGNRTKGINIDDIVVRSYPIYIIVSSAGPGGSIYPLDTSYVNQGDSLKFTITPNSGYVVDSVIVDGSYVGNVSSYTFYNVNANHTIRATFRQTPLQIFINDVSANEGHTGTTAFNFSVYLNKQNSTTVTVNYATTDGTASTSDNDYTSASGTVTFVAGDTIETITVYVNGDYKYEPDETFYVLLLNPTGNAEFGDSVGVGTILNDDNQPSISISDTTGYEGDAGTKDFGFYVTLSNPSYQTITVDYATSDGTATTTDSDYAPVSTTTLTFNPGDVTKRITVTVNGDTKYETDETFNVNLSSPSNATISDNLGVGTILNDDNQPTISISDSTGYEGNSGPTSFGFYVTLSNASADTVKVDYTTTDNTAEDENGDGDYTSTSGTSTFNPGETVKRIGVNVNGDYKYEPDETFYVDLSNTVNATISDGLGLGTILNDNSVPEISISDSTGYEGDTFGFYVSLSNPSADTIKVDYATSDGSAMVSDNDYLLTTGTMIFNPGETSKRIGVKIYDDNKYEPNETYYVNLSNPINATISDNLGLGTILNDDNQPTIAISDAADTEGNVGSKDFAFNVTLSNPSYETVTVDYATSDGTATTSDNDYASANGTLTFNAGETLNLIVITVNGDYKYEADETFFVDLTNANNASISDSQGLGTILNDDTV